jgi:protocatechuate 3,4-dioxygenase beta subunit
LSSGGILSGTPSSAPGTYNITITATDANGCTRAAVYAVVVNCPSIVINAPALPNGTKNVEYTNQQITASGGTAPYSWSIASGALPAGLSLSNSGLISGTPSATPGTYSFTVRATDGVNCAATQALQIVIACPTLSIGPVPLPSGVQYASYSQTLAVGGGTAPYTWTLASGVLPTGLTLSSGGVLSGTPTSLGSSTFTVRATDAENCTATQAYTFTVDYPPITILPPTLQDATRLVPYFQQITASGGTSPYTFTKLTGNLPSGISISSSGVISGTTSAAPGTYSFTVQALDANNAPGTQPYTITVLCPDFVISPSTLTNGVVGTSYSASLNATGGSAPYVWSIVSGTLPPGLSLSSTGLISGTPTQATTASFTVEARDAFNCVKTRLYTLAVNCPSISITPSSLSSAYYGTAYSQQLSATGGTGPYTWSVIAGSPPAGVTMSSSGLISGSPQVYGTASFTVRTTDANNCSSTQSYSLLVKGLSLGDVVYEDTNFNGLRDNGEPGIKDVVVELWDPGADQAIGGSGPNSDLMLSSTITGALGQYHFDDLQPGTFFLRVLMPSALNIPSGNPVNLDNGVDNDNNSASQPGGAGNPVFSPIIALTTGGEPTADDGDPDTDFTIDFGIFRGMSVGNLVWQDTNDNGLRDGGESGIGGIAMELWATGADERIGGIDDVRLKTTTTGADGSYVFTALPPLKVYVRIPTPPASQPLSSSTTTFADDGSDDDDNGHQVNGGSVYSPVITLTAADEPGTGGGTYDETTIDFGFLNVTPTVYVSATQADSLQAFDAGTGLYQGSLVSGFGSSLSQGNADYGDVPYAMELGQDGNWYVAHYGASNIRKISPSGVDLGPVLDNSTASVSLIAQFAIGPDGNFYVADVNGGRIVRFQGPTGTTPGAPIGTAPYTFITQNGVEDINFGPDGNLYLVVQTSNEREVRRYSTTTGELLNAIVTDTQLVDMVPGGQSIALISGIDIEGSTLYGVNRSDGEIFSVDLTAPAAPGLPQLIATISSAGKGAVDTRDVEFNPANNRLYISGYHWGKPVNAGTYTSGALLSVDVTGAPNGAVSIYEVPIPRPPGPNNEIWAGPRDLAIGRPFAPLPESVAIGSVVWNDLDADGVQDADENGIAGVRVELWQDANGDSADGAEVRIGWTYTDSNGHYYFSGQAPGVYQVQIPESNFVDGLPLAGSGYSSPISSIVDDQVDGDDSGRQPDGPKTVVKSPLITLTPGDEPLGNGTTGAEHARGGELDNYTVDANGDMTVDFGFVEPGIMGIGNLVFVDANGNNRFDVGEGRDDAVIELYRWGDTPGVTQPVATTITADGGIFLFSNLWQGQYFIHLSAPQFEATGSLRGLFSLPGFSTGDDDTGEDSLDTDTPWITGVSSGLINLVREEAPTDDTIETGFDSSTDLDDFNINLTVDIGLYRPVALGNLVFADDNSSGHYESGEGLSDVRVELYTDTQFPGVDNPLAFTSSDADGRYGFDFLRPGNYVVHIPASQFQSGGPLYQRISILEGLVGDDDVGEDGVNNGDPAVNGVSSLVISLYPGNAPTDDSGESGFEHTSDNQIDAAVDLTVDFGFQTPVGVGNLVYIDSNDNGFADVGEGVDGVTVELYRGDQTPGFGIPLFSRITSDGGKYFFDSLPAGSYIVHIPYSEFEPGHPLSGLSSSAGVSNVTSAVDDDAPDNENGIDDPTPFLNGISSSVVTLGVDSEPADAGGESGAFNDIDSFDDDNFNLTIDFGFAPSNPNGVGVGNLVFVDLNGNGTFDAGEGIDGVKVQLFGAEADPLTATPFSTVITSSGGSYLFSNLTEGDYKVFIPPSEFVAGKPLAGWRSLPGDGGDSGIDDNQDENGVDVADPSASGICSAVFRLAPDEEPTNSLGEFGYNAFIDDVNDDNTDLTIDFGFFRSVAVGNLVFIDANYNGRADAGEGIGDVTLELYLEGAVVPFDAPLATTTTGTDGSYLFADLTPGRYFVRVPAWQFDFGGPLYNQASVYGTQTGDDNVGEDGIDDGSTSLNGIQTAVFELAATNAPTGSQEAGYLGSSDDLDDAATNLTIDLGFVPRVAIGNLIFSDDNNDGIFDPNVEYGIDGVTVELWSNQTGATSAVASTTTYGGGLYNFNVAPGSYYVRVPVSNFAEGGALADLVPSKPAGSETITSTAGDDDAGQDGYTTGSVLVEGVRTALFTVLPGTAPSFDDTETGFLSELDDYDELNVDLTVDLGFSPKPLSVGNLVFRDVNANGIYDGSDFGAAGVKVRLFRLGDDPASSDPVMETTTSIDGTYLLSAYEAGQYFLHIPASEFTAGSALADASSSAGFGSDDGTDDDGNEDGLDAASPATTGISSIPFDLDYDSEPLDDSGESGFLAAQDAFNDGDTDLTLDLGFTGTAPTNLMSIGNLVFVDANNNGVADAGEGVQGVWMLLYAGTGAAGSSNSIRSTYTDADGRYFFTNLSPGTYTVHVAADNFKESVSINGGSVGPGPLFLKMSLRGSQTTVGDDNLGEDGVDVQNPEQVGITAPPVTLTADAAPAGAAESGIHGLFRR